MGRQRQADQTTPPKKSPLYLPSIHTLIWTPFVTSHQPPDSQTTSAQCEINFNPISNLILLHSRGLCREVPFSPCRHLSGLFSYSFPAISSVAMEIHMPSLGLCSLMVQSPPVRPHLQPTLPHCLTPPTNQGPGTGHLRCRVFPEALGCEHEGITTGQSTGRVPRDRVHSQLLSAEETEPRPVNVQTPEKKVVFLQ